MDKKQQILVIDDEESIRYTFESFLSDEGYSVAQAGDFDEAMTKLEGNGYSLVFADIILGGKTGLDIVREIRKRGIDCPVVMITGAPSVESASEAIRLGAFDYIFKPVTQETLLRVTRLALRHKAVQDEKEQLRTNLEAIFRSVKDAIITVDQDMRILEINKAAIALCGIRRDSVGQNFSDLSLRCNNHCREALEKTIAEKQPLELHRLECGRKGPVRNIVSVSTAPLLDPKGLFRGVVLVVKDETRVAHLEKDLNERIQFHNIIGKNPAMKKIYSLIEDLADLPTTVLISGESGTGKELVADAIHYNGSRRHQPLVKVNCSALSENLLESELFGHVKGAFTGAIKDKIGRFQRADKGTIFLDEIGDISPHTQLRLLRVLQEREFERVGDSTPVLVDVRVIAATNRNLGEKVKRGEFREDLYYRLKVIELTIPPLRERREDIPYLVEHFIKKFNENMNKEIEGISAEVQELFLRYPWPGNIRELEHALEHAFIICRQKTISMTDLPEELSNYAGKTSSAIREDCIFDEPSTILQALDKTAGNKALAARLLGIDRRTLYRKMQKHNLSYKRMI